MIQFVRYIDDPVVNAAAQKLVNCMAPSPFDWRSDNADKMVSVVLENLRRAYGDYARSVTIPVH
jgi:hypothetical protein